MIRNIFTIRHSEAEHQVNPNIWKTHGNAEIPLTILGQQQANDCGEFIASMDIDRAEKFLEKILLNSQDQQIENIIVVSHCVFNRALNKVLMQQTPEWLMAEKQHKNCDVKQFIRINHKWSDRGFTFVPQNKSLNNGVAKSLQKQAIGVER